MQKCLHSPNKRKSSKWLQLFAIAAACSACYVAGRLGISDVAKPYDYVKPMYLQFDDNTSDEYIDLYYDSSTVNESKMNNDIEKNSKNAVSEKNTGSKLILPSNVSIIDKNGIIVEMSLEDYVLGCLVGEMPLSFHPQALMAQSVAIRSFTLNKIVEGSKHKNAVSCMNPACCQNYVSPQSSGYSKELLEVARQAVKATEKIVAVSDGVPINAVYHASSAEKTKDGADVWGGKVQYLKSVKSPEGEAKICFANYSEGGGHGVGMSQQGANLLGKEGKSYKEILEYYYSGISFDVVLFE